MISYRYYSDGDLATITTPLGETITYTYDNLGRALSEKDVSNTYPAGQTTSYVFDGLGEVVKETSPSVTDRVTGAVHQAVTTTSYDADGDVLSQTVADATGGDSSRTKSYTYNTLDEVATATDGDNGVTRYSYDGYGNKTSEIDPGGVTTNYAYDPDGKQLSTTLVGYTGSPSGSQAAANLVTDSRTYDPAGRLASETDAMGFTTSFTYTDNGLPVTETRTSTVPGNTGSYVLQNKTYNAAGQMTQQVTGNGTLTTSYTVDAAGRVDSQTADPSGVDRTTSSTFDPDDRVLAQTVSSPAGSQATGHTYDAQGDTTSSTIYETSAYQAAVVWPLSQTSGTSVPDTSGSNTGTRQQRHLVGRGGQFQRDQQPDHHRRARPEHGRELDGVGGGRIWPRPAVATRRWSPRRTPRAAGISGSVTIPVFRRGRWRQTTSGSISQYSTPPPRLRDSRPDRHLGVPDRNIRRRDRELSLYVNGVLQGQGPWPSPVNAAGPMSIGEVSGAAFFDGQIGNVQAYSRALSASEITALYSAGRTSASGAGSAQQTTTTAYDQRGLPVSSTDPNGNTTSYAYDEAGQLAQTVAQSARLSTRLLRVRR